MEKEIEAQIKAKADKLLTDVAGYVSVQTMAIGLKQDLFSEIADGVIRTAQKYNNITILGIDGDEYSIKLAEEATNNVKLNERIKYKKSMFEDVNYKNEFDVVTINASIHECRDIDKVFSNVYNSLKEDDISLFQNFRSQTHINAYINAQRFNIH